MHNDINNNHKQQRPPWCWQEKSALRMINDADCFEGNGGSALAVYTALTWIASDHQRDTFSVSRRHIAARAGLSVSTLKRILPKLQQLDLIAIQPRYIEGIQTGNEYTIRRDVPPAHTEPPSVHGRNGGEPQLKNHKKNLKRKDEERVVKTTVPIFVPKFPYPKSETEMHRTLDKLGIEKRLDDLGLDFDPTYDGNFFAQMEANDWTIRGEPVWDWPEVYIARLDKTTPRGPRAKRN